MPTYYHECQNEECNHAWEDQYSIKADPPKQCPKCLQETAKRMINCQGGKEVLLAGQDLVDKVKQDAVKLRHELSTNENAYANFIGEDKYQNKMKEKDSMRDYMKEAKSFRRIYDR
jgi:putative FmdB family regulatory protein